jgi:hypothetical protein
MLNSISKTVAYATQLVPQLSNVNLHNYIHVAEYPNEHNIRYAEIRELDIFCQSGFLSKNTKLLFLCN